VRLIAIHAPGRVGRLWRSSRARRWLAALSLTAAEQAEVARERPGLDAVIDGMRAAAS
jgi:hypothetical protein